MNMSNFKGGRPVQIYQDFCKFHKYMVKFYIFLRCYERPRTAILFGTLCALIFIIPLHVPTSITRLICRTVKHDISDKIVS